jgi:hypothetical protein
MAEKRSRKQSNRARSAKKTSANEHAHDRYLFIDTAFPWCTTGRVDTPGGQASGAMVGPRHVLTCGHIDSVEQ